jgi:hypothetical protein
MRNFSIESCEDLIEKYVNELGGNLYTINEGCLGLGTLILTGANGKKSVLIREYFINSWNSGHDVKFYNKLPKKYEVLIENI